MNHLLNFVDDDFVSIICFIGIMIIMRTTSHHFPKKVYRNTIVTFILIFICSITAGLDSYIGGLDSPDDWIIISRRVFIGLTYSIRPVIIAMAIIAMQELKKKQMIFMASILLLNAIISMTIPLVPIVATVTLDNHFIRGPLGFVPFLSSGIMVVQMAFQNIYNMIKKKSNKELIILFIILSCLIATVIDIYGEDDYTSLIMSVSVLLYFLYLSSSFASYYEEKLVDAQRSELALSQIKPHFMYNTLSSIYYLCDHDSARAKEAVSAFSKYLRNNLDSMKKEQIVSFKEELSYTMNYLSLEKIRFGDELNYAFDIEADDFEIPKFTIQPLAENSIKHGISQKIGTGTLTISSKDKGDYYLISVRDDGIGFDTSKAYDDSRSHTGLENINLRLRQFSGETLHVESKPNEGCLVWFKIMKKQG